MRGVGAQGTAPTSLPSSLPTTGATVTALVALAALALLAGSLLIRYGARRIRRMS